MTSNQNKKIRIIKNNKQLNEKMEDVEIANNLTDALFYLLKEIDEEDCYKHIFDKIGKHFYEAEMMKREGNI